MWSHTRRAKLRPVAKPKAKRPPTLTPTQSRLANPRGRDFGFREDTSTATRNLSQARGWLIFVILTTLSILAYTYNLYYPDGLK